MRVKINVSLKDKNLLPALLIIITITLLFFASRQLDRELSDKITLYNEGSAYVEAGEVGDAINKFGETLFAPPTRNAVDIMAKYNIASTILREYLSEKATAEDLFRARQLLMDALRDVNVIVDLETERVDVTEIQKQLEIVNSYIEEEFGDQSGEGNLGEDDSMGGEEDGEDPFSSSQERPPTPIRPRGDY